MSKNSTITKNKNKAKFNFLAKDLPREIGGKYPKNSLIEITATEVLTENGFTPAEEQEILDDLKKAEKGIGVSEPMNPKDFIEHLNKLKHEY